MLHQVLCNWGTTLKQSSEVHIETSYSVEVILPGFCWLTSAFSYKFSFSQGGQLVNSPTAQSPERWLQILKNHDTTKFI
jgi:hypothetical protein